MKTHKTFQLFSVCVLLLCCSLVGYAQSGRRQPHVEPAAPVPTPTPEPTPKPRAEQKEPDVYIVIGADRNASFSAIPFTYFDAAIAGCAEVLSKSSASVDPSTKSVNRSDAIKRAKADSKTYVVWLELSARTMSGTQSNSGADIELEYTVFAPGTAKIVTSGRSYQNSNRAGPVVVSPPTSTGTVYREALLKRAGEDAGGRILRALHLDVPQTN